MSRQYASQLLFDITPSKKLRQLIFLIAGLCVFSIAIADIPHPSISLIFLIVVASLAFSSLQQNKFYRLQWQADSNWLLACHDNINTCQDIKAQSAILLGATMLFPWVTVLRFKLLQGGLCSVLIFTDNIDAEKFRQLRVRLKIEGVKTVAHDTLRE